MSVSDESADNAASKPPGESRKALRSRIRARYESSELSLRELARLEHVPESTIMKWSMSDHWQQRKRLVSQVARKLEADLSDKSLEIIRDELQPLIEAEKVKITKRGIKISNRGLSRIEKLWKAQFPANAKSEADGARAAETFLRMARTSLGMNEGTAQNGSLCLSILTGQAAVQINQNTPAPAINAA